MSDSLSAHWERNFLHIAQAIDGVSVTTNKERFQFHIDRRTGHALYLHRYRRTRDFINNIAWVEDHRALKNFLVRYAVKDGYRFTHLFRTWTDDALEFHPEHDIGGVKRGLKWSIINRSGKERFSVSSLFGHPSFDGPYIKFSQRRSVHYFDTDGNAVPIEYVDHQKQARYR